MKRYHQKPRSVTSAAPDTAPRRGERNPTWSTLASRVQPATENGEEVTTEQSPLASTRAGQTRIAPEVSQNSPLGRRVRAHERAHALQHRAWLRGVPAGSRDELEKEARQGARRLARGHTFEPRFGAPEEMTLHYPPRVEAVRDELSDGDESGAILAMGALTRSEANTVLRSRSMKDDAVSTFDNAEMYAAMYAMPSGDLDDKLRWMFAEGTSWRQAKRVMENSTHGHGFVWSSITLKGELMDLCTNNQMAEAVDLLRGTLADKFEWMGEEGTSFSALRRKVENADLAERLSLYSSGEAANVAIDVCNDRQMRLLVDAIGGSVYQKMSWLLAEGEFDYVPEAGETLPEEQVAPEAFGAPVIFGRAEEGQEGRDFEIFASVTVPGHAKAVVGQYLFGEDNPEELASAPEELPPGYSISIMGRGERVTERALSDFEAAGESDTLLRTAQMTEALDGDTVVYTFVAAGQEFQLLPAQMSGMLAANARRYQREATLIAGRAQSLNETRKEHASGTNSAVRGISDTFGDVDLPPARFASDGRRKARQARAAFQAMDPSDIPAAQGDLRRGLDLLREAAQEYTLDDMRWSAYIRGTIQGAQLAITTFRDVSFTVAAALAGAVAAPFAYASAATALTGAGATTLTTGGTLLASTAAVSTAAVTGSALKGTLEVTGATLQEFSREAVFEGEQDFDWGYVGERGLDGLETGLVDGGMGGVGHFQGAWLTARFGQAFAATRTGQVTIGAISGGSSEFFLATAEEVAAGDFSWENVGTRTVTGTLMGGAAPLVLPINGFYRGGAGGRISGNPFRSRPMTPEWIQASPWTRVQPRGTLDPTSSLTPRGTVDYVAVNQLPPEQLPPLPDGYTWARVNSGEWAIVHSPDLPDIDIHVWGPDSDGRYQLTVRQQDLGNPSRMLYSESYAVPQGQTRPQSQRGYPFEADVYIDPDTGIAYRRGHGIDHVDTDPALGRTDATRDAANYSPQTVDWNDYWRNHLVQRIRRGRNPLDNSVLGNAGPDPLYWEVSAYDGPISRVDRGEAIPERVYFIVADADGVARYAFMVPRTATRSSGLNAELAALQISLDQVPAPAFVASGFQNLTPAIARGADTLTESSTDEDE